MEFWGVKALLDSRRETASEEVGGVERTGLGGTVRDGAERTLEDDTGNGGNDDDRLEVRLVEEGDERNSGEVDTVNVD